MSSIIDNKLVSLGLFSAYAIQRADTEGKKPKKWLETMKKGLPHTFPDLNWIVYDKEKVGLKKEGIKEVFERSFILGKSLYFIMLFVGGCIELPKKYVKSSFFEYEGPKVVRMEEISKPHKVIKFFTRKSVSLRLIFESDEKLNQTEVFEKAYNHLKEHFKDADEIKEKAKKGELERNKELADKLKKEIDVFPEKQE